MRILYGVHTQGQGGLAKASILVPRMEALGHEVRVVSSGLVPPPCYSFRWHRHVSGMEYVVAGGRADSMATFNKWLRETPAIYSSLKTLRALCTEFSPQLVISDFEPLTANPLLRPGCEVVAASRPVALIDPQLHLPEGLDHARKLARTVIRLFTCGADRRLGYHVARASYRCLPPLVSEDVRRLNPACGSHLVVYNVFHTADGSPHDLIRWAARRRQYVQAYGFPRFRTGKYGYVTFHRPDRAAFLKDLASCRGVLCTAGVNLPVEAHLLGKPCAVVPIPNQWEQRVNAHHLQEAGIASAFTNWDYDALMELCEAGTVRLPTPWLQSTADDVLEPLLGQKIARHPAPVDTPQALPLRRAA
jgi:uncharacterized protein (TIGR00661 family)